jgi:hypothetical protein
VTDFPHFPALRGATILFILRTHANLELGNNPAAFREFGHGLRASNALSSELSLIAGLTRISHLAMLENCIWDGLAGRRWLNEELKAFEKQFAALRLANECRFAFATERGFGNAAMLELAKHGPRKLLEQMKPLEELGLASPPSLLEKCVWYAIPRGWVYPVMVRRNEYFDWLLTQFDEPRNGAAADSFPQFQSSEDWFESHPVPSHLRKLTAVMDMSLGVFEFAQKTYLRANARAQQTRLACALERFRRAKAAFPEVLEELVPEFMDAIPIDALDGKPLRYRRNADGGYDLWSIGSNRTDDGGKIDPEGTGDDQDDWLWHMPGPPKAL